jgi:hypothetical protein
MLLLYFLNFLTLRSTLLWDITQRRVVILYRRFGSKKIYSTWTSWSLKMGPIRWPETSVNDYHSTLRNTPEERRSHQHRGGSPKYFSEFLHQISKLQRGRSPYTRSRLILGATLYSDPPYTRSRLILGAALYSEPPYTRSRLILGAALCAEPSCTGSHLILGLIHYFYVRVFCGLLHVSAVMTVSRGKFCEHKFLLTYIRTYLLLSYWRLVKTRLYVIKKT